MLAHTDYIKVLILHCTPQTQIHPYFCVGRDVLRKDTSSSESLSSIVTCRETMREKDRKKVKSGTFLFSLTHCLSYGPSVSLSYHLSSTVRCIRCLIRYLSHLVTVCLTVSVPLSYTRSYFIADRLTLSVSPDTCLP